MYYSRDSECNGWCVCFQEERSRSEHNLLNIQKTHERMQTENKSQSPRFTHTVYSSRTLAAHICVVPASPQPPRTTAPS